MKHDPFGNLNDWGPVLHLLEELAENGHLEKCQPGLIRILRYKGNWRLREEVLKRIGRVQSASDELINQIITILADDNIYYNARILAGDALVDLLKNSQTSFNDEIKMGIQKVLENLKNTPQPPFFDKALKSLYAEIGLSGTTEN